MGKNFDDLFFSIEILRITNTDNRLFLFGPKNSREVRVNQGLQPINQNTLNSEVIYCRNTKDDVLLTVNQGNNNLEVTDLKTGESKSILKGYPEKPYCKL